jgi:hypothetical protein
MSNVPKAYSSEELRAKDLSIPCVECHAEVGEECHGTAPSTTPEFEGKRQTHFGRRLRWLFAERRPDLLEDPS